MSGFDNIILIIFFGLLIYEIIKCIVKRVFSLLLMILFGIIGIAFLFTHLWFIGLFIIVGSVILMFISDDKERNKQKIEEIQREKEQYELQLKEEQLYQQYNIPESASVIQYWGGHPLFDQLNFLNSDMYVWVMDNNLFLLSIKNDQDKKLCIPFDKIVLFDRKGDVFNEVHVVGTGGGGGGTSIGGAIAGGIIAGGVGAVVGSRKEADPINITSSNTVRDNRVTLLSIQYFSEMITIQFPSMAYDIFLRIIPQKEAGIVSKSNSESNFDVFAQIKKLSELKDNGILTEEEYIAKKRVLMDKIG